MENHYFFSIDHMQNFDVELTNFSITNLQHLRLITDTNDRIM